MDIDPNKPPDPPDISLFSTTTSKRRLDTDCDNSIAKKTIVDNETASASIQCVYTHPSLVVGIKAYTSRDPGPFLVHVSRTEPHPSAGTTIKPIKLGQFLYQNKIPNICPDGVKRVGRNKVSVEFKTGADANKFLDYPLLETNKYQATIPTYIITKMGIVRQIPVDLSMNELVESLTLPSGCGYILKARRLNRKTVVDNKPTWIPTQTVVLTFQGQILPDRVFLFHNSLPIDLYEFPTIICQNCCRYGHVKAQCRSTPRCYRCAQPHAGESCEVVEDKSTCLHCSGRHFASSKRCPERDRQIEIKKTMARNSISYEEASRSHAKSIRPFSEVAQHNIAPSHNSQPLQIRRPSVPPTSSSYRKTVPLLPRPRTPLGKSYDRSAHHAIVADLPSSFPNGHALSQNSSLPLAQEDNLLEMLLTMIITIITTTNSNLPPHVAQKLTQIISYSGQNGSSLHSSMESQKSSF